MSTIVTRAGKGSPLTNTEVDSNFTNLNTDKVEKSGDTLTGDLAFGDNVKAKFGDLPDLQIYHTGTESFIDETGQGGLYIRSNFAELRSPTNESFIKCQANDFVKIYHDNTERLATTSSGVDITGTVVADGLQLDGNATITSARGNVGTNHLEFIDSSDDARKFGIRFGNTGNLNLSLDRYYGGAWKTAFEIDRAGPINFYEDTGTTAKLTWDASAEELQFKDNVKATFGDGNDLRIYHSGTQSYIQDQGTGNLNLLGNSVVIANYNGGENYIRCISNDAVELYYDNSAKLATTSTGIDVTGTVTADGLTLGAADQIVFGSDNSGVYRNSIGNYLSLLHWGNVGVLIDSDNNDSGTRQFVVGRNSKDASTADIMLKVAETGDISFYNDAGTSQDLYWDASTSRLGLGVTSPLYQLQLGGSSDDTLAFFRSTTDTAQIVIRDDDTIGYFGARNNFIYISPTSGTGADGLVVRTDTGNVGIGTTSPTQALDVNGSIASDISINAQTGTTYTTVLTDRSKLITADNASAVTITIPPNSSVAYPTGTKIDLLAKGAGQVTVAAGSGVTVNSAQSLKLRAQWSAASAIKLATDTWVLVGDLQAI